MALAPTLSSHQPPAVQTISAGFRVFAHGYGHSGGGKIQVSRRRAGMGWSQWPLERLVHWSWWVVVLRHEAWHTSLTPESPCSVEFWLCHPPTVINKLHSGSDKMTIKLGLVLLSMTILVTIYQLFTIIQCNCCQPIPAGILIMSMNNNTSLRYVNSKECISCIQMEYLYKWLHNKSLPHPHPPPTHTL